MGTIILTNEYKLKFDFDSADDEDIEAFSYDKTDVIGQCPKCGNDVIVYKSSYICSEAIGKDKSCSFRSGLAILQQPIAQEQMHKLLEFGKTDLLDAFVSTRTRRKFKAFLVLKEDKSIGFEFLAKQKKVKHPN